MKKIAAITAGLALAAGLLVTPATAQAAPTPAFGAGSETHKIDMDGDGRKDTVTITEVPVPGGQEGHEWLISVRTAKGKAASTQVFSEPSGSWGYEGAAKLDPVKGYEIKVPYFSSETWVGTGRKILWYAITWRNNRLVVENPPPVKSGSSDWWLQSVNDTYNDNTWTKAGYYFWTSKGKHYARWFDLVKTGAKGKWKGWLYDSVWKNGKWTYVK